MLRLEPEFYKLPAYETDHYACAKPFQFAFSIFSFFRIQYLRICFYLLSKNFFVFRNNACLVCDGGGLIFDYACLLNNRLCVRDALV